MRLLLVEDEKQLASALNLAFSRLGALIDHASSCAEAMAAASYGAYDAIILDRHLPDGEGLSIIPDLRRKAAGVPILVLSARAEPAERVTGLNRGADDYLGKPFDLDELIARVRALLRRPTLLSEETTTIGRMVFNSVTMQATVDEQPLSLRRREMMVLAALMRRPGKMVLRPALEEAVYGLDEEIQSNSLDAHVSRLRSKLSAAEAGVEIHGVRGVGYLLQRKNGT